jgi:hypothetical protein
MTAAFICSFAGLFLSAFSFLFLLHYLKRRTGQERILAEFRDEVEEIIHQIDEVTDRDLTLLEERTKTLRTLLEDTDRRIAVYAREVERRRSQEEAFAEYDRGTAPVRAASRFGYTRLGAPIAGNAPAEPIEPLRPEPAEPVSPEAPSPHVPAELPPPQGQFPRIVRASRPIEPKPLPFAERVAELSRAGFSANLIAAQLGAAVVEVELAIALADRSGGGKVGG